MAQRNPLCRLHTRRYLFDVELRQRLVMALNCGRTFKMAYTNVKREQLERLFYIYKKIHEGWGNCYRKIYLDGSNEDIGMMGDSFNMLVKQ